MITLKLDGSTLELTKDNYKEALRSVEETHTTEAGTTIRMITRLGIYELDVSITGTEAQKKQLDSAVLQESLTVTVWDESAEGQVDHQMYIDPSSYSSTLIVEDGTHRYYKLSFTLKDLE